tara:strand:- start:1158 stop:1316 length:159 start_codon:yes stop_codon:yes gene_type:complete
MALSVELCGLRETYLPILPRKHNTNIMTSLNEWRTEADETEKMAIQLAPCYV